MNIAQLQRLQQIAPDDTDRARPLPQPRQPREIDGPRDIEGPDFSETFKNALERVDETQKTADDQVEAFIAGEQENLHDVMIAMNQAKLHFELMTEVRNRALDTYRELMRMQV